MSSATSVLVEGESCAQTLWLPRHPRARHPRRDQLEGRARRSRRSRDRHALRRDRARQGRADGARLAEASALTTGRRPKPPDEDGPTETILERVTDRVGPAHSIDLGERRPSSEHEPSRLASEGQARLAHRREGRLRALPAGPRSVRGAVRGGAAEGDPVRGARADRGPDPRAGRLGEGGRAREGAAHPRRLRGRARRRRRRRRAPALQADLPRGHRPLPRPLRLARGQGPVGLGQVVGDRDACSTSSPRRPTTC